MNRAAICRKLEPILQDVVDPGIILTDGRASAQEAVWDSMKNIILVIEIEHQLGVTLSTDEMANLHNVEDLITLLDAKGVGV